MTMTDQTVTLAEDQPFPGMPEPDPNVVAVPANAVAQYPKTCWVLSDPHGRDYDNGDGVPHYDTEAEAREAISRTSGDDPLTPRPLAAPCWTISSACGYTLDEDESTWHHDSAAEAHKVALGYGWTDAPGGLMRCDANCDGCAEEIKAAA
jgi:hypothetical protein